MTLLDIGQRVERLRHPRARGVHHDTRVHLGASSLLAVLENDAPAFAISSCRYEAGPGQNTSAVVGGIPCIEHDQTRIVDPTVGVDESTLEFRLQANAVGAGGQIDAVRCGQRHATAQAIVEKKPGSQHPCGAKLGHVRHYEAHGSHDVRCYGEQHLTFGQGFAHESKLEVLEIAQATVNELAARR